MKFAAPFCKTSQILAAKYILSLAFLGLLLICRFSGVLRMKYILIYHQHLTYWCKERPHSSLWFIAAVPFLDAYLPPMGIMALPQDFWIIFWEVWNMGDTKLVNKWAVHPVHSRHKYSYYIDQLYNRLVWLFRYQATHLEIAFHIRYCTCRTTLHKCTFVGSSLSG